MKKSTASLYVTNFKKRFTGVSSTAAAVLRQQQNLLNVALVGYALPKCAKPIGFFRALWECREPPAGREFSIWHTRRNIEMQLAILARDVLRLPIRIVFTSAAQRRHSAWPRWLISRMDAVIATTEEAAKYVPNVVAVVPHGVDTEHFLPAQEESYKRKWKELQLPGEYGIITVGRVRPEKGTDLFIDAMITALPDLPGACAIVVGTARPEHQKFQEKIKKRAEAAGLSNRIVFLGEVDPDKLQQILQGCRALVALPRYEGYGMTPLEAMATGLPVILSETGYFKEFVGENDTETGSCGAVVPIEGAELAAEALVRILKDKDLYHQKSIAARKRAVRKFSVTSEVNAINIVYEDLWSLANKNNKMARSS